MATVCIAGSCDTVQKTLVPIDNNHKRNGSQTSIHLLSNTNPLKSILRKYKSQKASSDSRLLPTCRRKNSDFLNRVGSLTNFFSAQWETFIRMNGLPSRNSFHFAYYVHGLLSLKGQSCQDALLLLIGTTFGSPGLNCTKKKPLQIYLNTTSKYTDGAIP